MEVNVPDINSEFMFDFNADLDWAGMLNIGTTPRGARSVIYCKGGMIEGPKIKGVVLPGGGDWPIMRPDGGIDLDVRAAARMDDGNMVYTYYRGISTIRMDTLQAILEGQAVDHSEYYFRTTPVFETASEKYGWLNRIVAVGVGQFLSTGVAYKVYAIL
jgi:hypothetical protein